MLTKYMHNSSIKILKFLVYEYENMLPGSIM